MVFFPQKKYVHAHLYNICRLHAMIMLNHLMLPYIFTRMFIIMLTYMHVMLAEVSHPMAHTVFGLQEARRPADCQQEDG